MNTSLALRDNVLQVVCLPILSAQDASPGPAVTFSLMLDECTDATVVMGTFGAIQPDLSEMPAIFSSVTCVAAQA